MWKKTKDFAIRIGLYENDMENFRKAAKIFSEKARIYRNSDEAIGRAMLLAKIDEILKGQ